MQAAVQKQANIDRPGEVGVVEPPHFVTDPADCPQTGQAADTTVLFTTEPKTGVYIYCKARTHWVYANGPL